MEYTDNGERFLGSLDLYDNLREVFGERVLDEYLKDDINKGLSKALSEALSQSGLSDVFRDSFGWWLKNIHDDAGCFFFSSLEEIKDTKSIGAENNMNFKKGKFP